MAVGAGASVRCKGVLVGEGAGSLLPGCEEAAGRSRRGGIGTFPAEVSGDRALPVFRTGMGMATGMAEGWPAGLTPRDVGRAASPPPPGTGTASAPGTPVVPGAALPPGTPVPPPPAPPEAPDAGSATADLGCPPRRAPDGTEDGVTGGPADGVTDRPAAEATGGVPGDMADAALGASFRGVADDVSLPEAG